MPKIIDPEEYQKRINAAHIEALPFLLVPMVEAAHTGKGLSSREIRKILRDWDKARRVKRE